MTEASHQLEPGKCPLKKLKINLSIIVDERFFKLAGDYINY